MQAVQGGKLGLGYSEMMPQCSYCLLLTSLLLCLYYNLSECTECQATNQEVGCSPKEMCIRGLVCVWLLGLHLLILLNITPSHSRSMVGIKANIYLLLLNAAGFAISFSTHKGILQLETH